MNSATLMKMKMTGTFLARNGAIEHDIAKASTVSDKAQAHMQTRDVHPCG